MTTATSTGVPSIATATDTWYRGLKTHVSDVLTTLGFPKTTDTGQVDWATVTVPASAVYTNYEIRRFNDSYQTTDPIYMKIGYGRITISSVQYPVLSLDFGTGSNGSGSLTGVVGTTRYFIPSYNTTVKLDNYFSTDGSGIAWLAGGTSTNRFWFLLERLRGSDGEPLAGQFILSKNSNNTSQGGGDVQTFHFDMVRGYMDTLGGVPVGYVSAISSTTSSLAVLGSGKYPFGVLSLPTESGRGYSKLMVGYAQGDFLHNTEFDLTRFSDSEVVHYKCIKPESAPTFFGGPMDGSTSTFAASNPILYATPALYWA